MKGDSRGLDDLRATRYYVASHDAVSLVTARRELCFAIVHTVGI